MQSMVTMYVSKQRNRVNVNFDKIICDIIALAVQLKPDRRLEVKMLTKLTGCGKGQLMEYFALIGLE